MGLLEWLKRKFGRGTPGQKLIEGEVDPRLSKTKEELCRELDEATEKAKATDAKVDELKRAYAGLLNDQQSFQKRLQKEKERAIAEGSAKVVRELLDVSDEIDRALDASADETGPLAEGVRMIHGSMQGRLTKLGVERMELKGKLYNPTMAEALEVVPVEGADQDEVILDVFRAGYLMNGQVVREAKVRVGRYIPPAPPPAPEPAPESEEARQESQTESAPAPAAQDAAAPAGGESAGNAGENGEGQKQEQPEAPSAPAEAVKADEAKPEEAKAEEPKPAEAAPEAAVQPQPSDAAAAEQQPAPSAASPEAAPAADSPKAS